MRQLVLTPKFRRAYRKLAKRDRVLQERLDDVLGQMQADVFAPALGTHKLGGTLLGLWRVHVATTVEWSFRWRSMKVAVAKSSC